MATNIEDERIDVSKEVNFIWSIANSLRGPYKSDKYKDVIIPMTIIRRLECALADTKQDVVKTFESNKNTPALVLEQKAGYAFYNTSKYDLKELLNDSTNLADNFKSYLDAFSPNVRIIFGKDKGLDFYPQIDKMDKNNRLFSVIKKFSELDLNPKTVDNQKMGYMFEEIIKRFSENAEAGDHYTPREVIRLMVNILLSEGCDDLREKGKVITVLDMACGTGGMLSTAERQIKKINPNADVQLFGQEVNPESYAICLADMLIKGQNVKNIQYQDTLKKDSFPDNKMRFVIANPPFGTAWAGKDAPEGDEKAVRDDNANPLGRFTAGLPTGGDAQMLFMQHGLYKLDEKLGRAAIISNGSPLFSGGTASGESQIRRMMLEKDMIEAIIALPTDLFYNTGIGIYLWIFSKNKRPERRNKVQLINCTSDKFYNVMRKSMGKKRHEISNNQILEITKLYNDFKENEYCKIFDKEEFLYREYAVYQPMQRDYAINDERIENLINSNFMLKFYNQNRVDEIELLEPIPSKEKKELEGYKKNKPIYDEIISKLNDNKSEKVYMSFDEFIKELSNILNGLDIKKDFISKIANELSAINKDAEVQKDGKGNIIYDNSTKDSELVKENQDIDEYMKREVYPHVPDAHYVFEENMNAKKPVIKTGAEIPFTRYFYKYQEPEKSEDLEKEFMKLEKEVNSEIKQLFEEA